MPQIAFGIGSYESRAPQLSSQRLVNCFVERQPPGAKSQAPVFGLPGLIALYLLSTLGVRGFWNFNGVLFTVAGDTLYSISSGGVITPIGTGILGTGNVSMADNGLQIVIVNGVDGWIYGPSTAFQKIVNINFYSANTVLFFDGYFVFDRVGTNEFFLSGLYDGLSYSGTDFASAEAQPGFLIATAQNLQMLFLFCQNHIEMWFDAGAADFPFQRYAGGVIPYGTNSALSVIPQDGGLFFLGNDRVFYRLQGNVPSRISNHAVEHAFSQYGNIDDAFCMTYTLEGHKLIVVTFPSVPATWAFDLTTQEWHNRTSWDSQAKDIKRWRANCAIQIYDKILIGDYKSGQIWQMDWNTWTEGDNIMPFQVTSNTIQKDRIRIFCNRLEIDFEQGVGLTTGQGSDPQVWLQWSKDGGLTWSDLQPPRSLGKIGEYTTRCRWLNIGQAYQFTFRVVVTDPVKRVLIGAYADMEEGMP